VQEWPTTVHADASLTIFELAAGRLDLPQRLSLLLAAPLRRHFNPTRIFWDAKSTHEIT